MHKKSQKKDVSKAIESLNKLVGDFIIITQGSL